MLPLLLIAVLASPLEVEVQTLDGRSVAGVLVSLSSDGVVVKSLSGDVKLPMQELMAIGPRAAPAKIKDDATAWVELVDGSLLPAKRYAVKDRVARVEFAGGPVEISTDDVRTVRFKPTSAALAKQWSDIVGGKASADQIVLRKRDDAIDSTEGIARDVTDEHVRFEVDGETPTVKRERIEGIVYYHAAGRKLPATLCVVEDALGKRLAAASLALDKDILRIKSPAGVELPVPLASLARLDFAAGKVRFLGDLEPEAVQWTPYLSLAKPTPEQERFFRPRVDRALRGGSLQLPARGPDGKTQARSYSKGLAIHSRTVLVYRLPEGARVFRALAGIDSRVRDRGHVRLVIHADDKKLYDAALTGKDDPVSLDLDVRGASRLKILVDFGLDADVADHLNLCEARVIK